MNDFKAFMQQNAVETENIKFAVSARFLDDKKKPIEWEIKAVTSDEDARIRKAHTKKVTGKGGVVTQNFDAEEYLAALAARCVVYPNLNNAELQNSYGVMSAEQLIKKMLKPGEYQTLLQKVQEVNGYDVGINELVEEAKN